MSAEMTNPSMNRREMMRRTGALAVGAAAAGTGAEYVGLDPVDEAEGLAVTGAAVLGLAAGALVGGVAGAALFSSGYSEEDVDDITSTNLHWGIYQSIEQYRSQKQGYIIETENWVEPSSPESGSLAEMAWSEARAEAFKAISDGSSRADVRSQAVRASVDYLSVRQKNYIRQANENIFDLVRHIANFVDFDELPDSWSAIHPETDPEEAEVSHKEGEPITEDVEIPMTTSPDGLKMNSVFELIKSNPDQIDGTVNQYSAQSLELSTNTYQCLNGDEEIVYNVNLNVRVSSPGGSETSSITFDPVSNSPQEVAYTYKDGDTYTNSFNVLGIRCRSPQEGSSLAWTFEDYPYGPIHAAIDSVYNTIQSDMRTYIETVYEEVDAGDIDPSEILSPTDYITQFGDSDGVTRLHAELVGLGMSPPDDTGMSVTLAPSTDGLDEARTGTLYLDWNWSKLEPWEFTFDKGAGTLTVDADSWLPDSVYEPTFPDNSIAIPAGDFEETEDGAYRYSFDDGALSGVGELQSVATDVAGEQNSFIPTGTEVAGSAGHAILVATDGEEVERISFGEDDSFEVQSIVDGDGQEIDRYTITGFDQSTRDPARSLDQALWYSEQRQTTEDISKQGSSLFGGGAWLGDDGLLPVFIGTIAGIPIWLLTLGGAYTVNTLRS